MKNREPQEKFILKPKNNPMTQEELDILGWQGWEFSHTEYDKPVIPGEERPDSETMIKYVFKKIKI